MEPPLLQSDFFVVPVCEMRRFKSVELPTLVCVPKAMVDPAAGVEVVAAAKMVCGKRKVVRRIKKRKCKLFFIMANPSSFVFDYTRKEKPK